MVEKNIVIINEVGLHARPASNLVREAKNFKCNIEIIKAGKSVNAKSLIGVLSLGAGKGQEITVKADGEDENKALDIIIALIESGLGE